jgi:hypothetical protein
MSTKSGYDAAVDSSGYTNNRTLSSELREHHIADNARNAIYLPFRVNPQQFGS